MNVLVLLAGVVDTKHPLPNQTDTESLLGARANRPLLSPFDEAALEVALKLRDADPDTQISALLLASSERDTLLRTVASFRLNDTLAVSAGQLPTWDAVSTASTLANVIRAQAPAYDVVLMGREFGDGDDGALPAALAAALDRAYAPLVLSLTAQNGQAELLRQSGSGFERWQLAMPLLASVTNDPQNRLRHPLLKNVMAAKKMAFTLLDAGVAAPRVQVESSVPAAPPARAAHCDMITGTPAEQAAALATLLHTAATAS